MKSLTIILAAVLIGGTAAADGPPLAISKPGAHSDRIIGSYLYEAYVTRRKERRAYALQQRRAMSSRRPPAVIQLSGGPNWYRRPVRIPRYPIRSRYLTSRYR